MAKNWYFLGGWSIILIYFYFFMEWLFFVTKPSFFSTMGIYDDVLVLITAPIPPVLIVLAAIVVLWVASQIMKHYVNQGLFTAVTRVIPAFVMTTTIFILVDNFTYTLFRFGVKSIDSLWRLGYGAFFILLFIYLYRKLLDFETGGLIRFKINVFLYTAILLIGISGGGIALSYLSVDSNPNGDHRTISKNKKLPNILLLASDGLNADHMSVYGYLRDTTPFIKTFSKKALVFDNFLPSTGNSGGSIASILTGKLPTQIKVIYPPDILRGKDAYEHLPAILRKQGYRSIDLSVRHYADAYDLNMRNSFDFANSRQIKDFKLRGLSDYFGVSTFDMAIFFIGQIFERMEGRLIHISGGRKMIDPFEEVTTRKLENDYSDGARVLEFFRFMEESDKPLFAHIHLMGTHGSRFLPLRRIFSSGKEQDKPWMVDFYDDAILEFDKGVEVIIRYLKRNNQLKNTVVVIHTDHGMRWKTNVRIPFIVYFPDESHAGRVSTNAQHIDIAPTILDYLGIEIPDWMVGESLLSPGIDKLRPIIGVSVSGIIKRENLLQEKTDLSPPFYGLGFVSVTVCHKFYGLNLKDKTFLVSDIKGHTAPCEASELPSQAEARDYIVNHLRENGYDVSSII